MVARKNKLFAVLLIVVLALPALAVAPSAGAQEGPSMPLAAPGAYGVGKQDLTFVDDSREGRNLVTVVWYPALDAGKISHLMPKADAKADLSGAPYPLIIYSHGLADSPYSLAIGPYLASHGFVVAAAYHQESLDHPDWSATLTDRPLDIRLILDQMSSLSDSDLAGVIDSSNIGVFGWSFGATTALLMGGAQVDPGYLTTWCAENEPDAVPNAGVSGSACQVFLARWQQVSAYHDQVAPSGEAGLWPPMANEHIGAVLAVNPCFFPLLGDQGTAALTSPALVIYPGGEAFCGPTESARLIYQHLGSTDKYLLTMLGASHFEVLEIEALKQLLRQVTVAFFGYYLQGREDYRQYLTGEYINTLPNVAWESSLE